MLHSGVESDALSEMELEYRLVWHPSSAKKRRDGLLASAGSALSPAVAGYLAFVLVGWLSVQALEIGCAGGLASISSPVQPSSMPYAAEEEHDVPISPFLAGTDLHFTEREQQFVRTFVPVHFPAVPLLSLLRTDFQQISVTPIQVPGIPLPPQAASKIGAPQPPTALTVN